jgi:CRP-like cAMP-binding protein
MVSKQTLLTVPLFDKLSDAEREKIASITFTRKFSKDMTIFWQNDPADQFFIVFKGKVKINRIDYDFEKKSKKLGEYTLEVLKSGDFFGEDSLIDGKKYSSSATNLTDSVIFVINKGDFNQLAQENPDPSLFYSYLKKKISRLTTWEYRSVGLAELNHCYRNSSPFI